jgi:hypothetical protein
MGVLGSLADKRQHRQRSMQSVVKGLEVAEARSSFRLSSLRTTFSPIRCTGVKGGVMDI